MTKEFMDSGRLIASICHAGWVPVSAEICGGLRMTSPPAIKDVLRRDHRGNRGRRESCPNSIPCYYFGIGRKVYLILDNLKVHRSSAAKTWLAAHRAEIEVHCLPPYSPELNPDEYPNGAQKEKIHRGLRVRDSEGLTYKVRSFMRKLCRRPPSCHQFFQAS